MSKFTWDKRSLSYLRKVGPDRMNSEAWELVEDLLTYIDELKAELAKARQPVSEDAL